MNISGQALSPGEETGKPSVEQTFSKAEKLCSVKTISILFETGNIFHNSLFKVVWMYSPADIPSPAQVAFSVSKKGFKKAVSRNLAKRRMREAYRKNKFLLYEHLTAVRKQIVFMIILKGNTIPGYIEAEKAMISVISKIISLTTIRG